MIIDDIRITPIAVADPPLRNAAGIHAPYALRIIVELLASNGLVGISEIPGDVRTEDALRESAEFIVGTDPFALNVLAERIEKRRREHAGARFEDHDGEESRGDAPWDRRITVHVQSAVEVACLDLIGKETGHRACDILGGAVRERVPFAAYLFYKERGAGGRLGFDVSPATRGWPAARQAAALDPEGIVAQAHAMCDAFGFESVKLKGGVFPPEEEVSAVLALREAFGPSVPLRFDPNAAWSLKTAIAMGKRLEGVLEYYEDPVRGQEAMAEIGKTVDIPRATNMCTTSFDDIPSGVRLGSEDIILADHHFWGGIRPCIELGRVCRTFGRGLSMHSNTHLGVSLAAMVHLAAATPHLTYALDTHYPWQSDEVIVGGRFDFDSGTVKVPDGPGLGVELDREKLSELHANYVECGLTHRDDEAEMRKLEPGWTFVPTRW